MNEVIKPRWIAFEDLLNALGKKHAQISGDGDLGQRTALNEMLEALQWGAWLSRTKAPDLFTFRDRGHAVPLEDGYIINPQFWRYYHEAYTVPGGAPYEQLARGGPWATWFWDRDGFEFGLEGDENGSVLGRVTGVEVWALTGALAKPGRGRKEGAKGRGDPKGYKAAVSRIIADIDRAETPQAKLEARAAGIVRESHVVKAIAPDSAEKHLRALLVEAGYSVEDLDRRF